MIDYDLDLEMERARERAEEGLTAEDDRDPDSELKDEE